MNTPGWFRWLMVLAATLACVIVATAQQTALTPKSNVALTLTIHDAIGPATSSFFLRALETARKRNVQVLILEMDTPGGLDTAMREMIQAILASPIPVAVYVSPSGSRAASAGTYLLYASHIAAMAPATNLGAATPVQIGATPSLPQPSSGDKKKEDKDKEDQDHTEPGTAMERKVINDSIAYIRGLAELRGRNAEWAETAVRSAATLTATAALEQKVIDIVATDLADLLKQMQGRTVKTNAGEVTLETKELIVERVETDWRTKLLAVITNPNVAYLLLLVGVYGLLLEGYHPGAILPGVIGGIAMLIALYAFQVLSVNYAGLGLIVLGIGLMIAEAFVPSFGALGVGGVSSFVIGSIMLMDVDAPGFQIARPLIAGVALAAALVLLLMVSYFVRSRRRPIVTGAEQLLREPAVALGAFERSGSVRVRGEIWNAVTRAPVQSGEILRVVHVDGLTLEVEPLGSSAAQEPH